MYLMRTTLPTKLPSLLDDFDNNLDRILGRIKHLNPDYVEYDIGAVNVSETDLEYQIEMHLPGFKKEDVKIKVKDGVLSIVAEYKDKQEDKKYLRKEIIYNKVERAFILPKNADSENIKAKVDDGILLLTIPKSEKDMSKEILVM